MTPEMPDEAKCSSQLESNMMKNLGPLLGGEALWRALGFSSAHSFRRALRNGEVRVQIFRLPNRRGAYALTTDVARWIDSQRIPQEGVAMGT